MFFQAREVTRSVIFDFASFSLTRANIWSIEKEKEASEPKSGKKVQKMSLLDTLS